MGAVTISYARRAWQILVLLALTLTFAASTPSFAQTGRLLQLSTRDQVLTGDDVMIGGFVIAGSSNKTVAIVATGPSLSAFGVANPLGDPILTLVRSADRSVIATNDNWQTAANSAQLQAAGLAPTHPQEAAILINLQPGAYTAIVEGAGGGTGVGIIAVYEVDHPEAPLVNISTRARVLTGENVMIAGFSVGPSDPNPVVVTVAGPSLAQYGVANPLQNPNLALVRMSDRTVIATNDDWQVQANPGDVASLQANGLHPSDPREPAIIATLQPGLYTAIASGVGNTTGVAVVSVYQAIRSVAITSANNATFTVGTAGTFTITTAATPTATSITTTPLPAGLSLSATSGTGTATISGTPTGPTGTFTITITASNGGVTPDGTQSFTLTVNQAPAITSANAATFQLGSPSTHTVVATGSPTPTLSVSGALPAGVTFDPATGVLSGTPTAGGIFPLVFTAANGVGSNATQNFTLTVTQTVAITSANATTFQVGSAGTFTITTSATPTANLITITGALPAGVTLGATSGTGTAVLSGTPAGGTGGSYPVTITASNGGVTPNGTQSFTLTVGQAPAITSGNAATFTVGTAGSFAVTSTGFPAATYAVTAGTLPSGVTLNPTTGALAGTPAAATGGSYPITITASNGFAPNATQSFTLTVNQAPTITSAASTTFTVGTLGTFSVTATGVPAAMTFTTASALPAGVTLSAGGVLSGTPGPATGGVYPITIQATNGVAPAGTQNFTLTVNQAPAITSANAVTFNVGTPGTFTVTTTGFPTGAAMVIGETGALPSGVTFVNNNDGTATLSGTPAAGTAAGSPYALTIGASNTVAPPASQPFTLTVTDGAVAVDDAFSVVHDSGVNNFAAPGVLVNDLGTPAPTVLSVQAGGPVCSLPCVLTTAHGTATFASNDGAFTYAPTAGYAGPDTFTYVATNAGGTSAPATVTITVTNALPVLDLNGGVAGIDFAANFTEGGGPVAIVDPAQLTVTDADDTQLTGATIVITNLQDGLSESLGFTCTGVSPVCEGAIPVAAVTYTAATGTLEILATAPLADFQKLLRTITYVNAAANPTGTTRDVSFTINDGNDDNLPIAHSIVTIAGVNQAPTITAPATASTPVNTALVFSGTVSVADPDAGTADVTVTLTATNGTVTLSALGGLTSVTGNGTANVIATAPLANLNASLNGASFNPTAAFTGAATLTINANDNGNTGAGGPLSAVPKTINITVATSPTFTSAAATTFTIGQAGTFTVTTSASPPVTAIARTGVALPSGVSYADNGNGTATLSGTPAAATDGTYGLVFTATNGTPPDGVQNFTLTIAKQAQTISFTSVAPGGATVGGPTYVVTATATSALPVTFTIDPTASTVCTIAGSTVSFIGAGTCVINANQAGNGTFSAAPQAQQTFAVGAGAQTISFTSVAPVGAVFGGPTYNVTATATSSLAVTFTIDPSASTVCSIAGSTVSFIGAGTCVINANQAGNANYTAAPQVQQSFAVAKASQTISFTSVAPATPTVGGATYNVTATATSGLPVTFTIDAVATAVCSIAGSTVSFTGNGTCVIDANQAGDANYNAAPQVQQSFVVKSAQTITFTSSPPATPTVGGATYNVTATATSALPVAFTIDPSASTVCSIAGSTVSFGPNDGTCVINANQAGNASFYAAPQVQQSFTVKKSNTITFTSTAPTAAVFNGPTYGVAATATSGLTVTLTIDATAAGVCSIAGSTVSFIGTGTCVINANQAGNASYYPAPQVQQSFTVGPNLVGDSYSVVGNTQLVADGQSAPATPFTTSATNILANDTSNVAIAITPVTGVATTGGGLITIDAVGKFTYTPPVGQSSGTDTYVYTGTSNGVARTATITFNIANVVWYVNQAAGAGDGRSNTPFNTLGAAGPPSAANSFVYVHTGAGTTTGNLVMDTNQELHGQGVAFTLGALSIPAGARPTLNGSVTLADDTVITGVNFAGGAGAAISGPAITANNPILIDQVNVTGYANALSLTTMNGTGGITFSNAAISNTTGAEVLINGGNIPVNFPASTTISGNAGPLIDITNRTGGAVTFAGALTDTGTGIFLNSNNSTAFTFSGGMTLNGVGATLTATNPAQNGTLSITGTNNIGATVAPAGPALNVSNIVFPAGGITFRSVHANGGVSGIVINNTGATAGLTITGSGSAILGGDNSGGTLQNVSQYGISLTSTRNVSLTNMNIQSAGRSGIDGQQVTNFTFAAGKINSVGTAAAGQYEESNIAFNDGGSFTTSSVDGTVSITNSSLTNARRHGIQIENGSGTISNLTITGNQVASSAVSTTSLGTAILVMPQGSAGTTAHITTGSISNNTISNFPSGEGIAVLGGSGNVSNTTSSTLGANGTPIVINANSINGGGGASRMGSNAIHASLNGRNGVANFNITNNNPITNIEGQGVSVFLGGTVTGTTNITGNVIVANQTIGAGTAGMAVQVDDGPVGDFSSAADYNFIISNNNVSNYEGFGIRAIARNSQAKMDATIQNNVVGTPGLTNRNGIRVDSGSGSGDTTVCLLMTGNTSAGSGLNQGMGIRKQGTVIGVNDFGIVGLAPSPATAAQAAAKVTADNPAGNGTDPISGNNYVSCTITP